MGGGGGEVGPSLCGQLIIHQALGDPARGGGGQATGNNGLRGGGIRAEINDNLGGGINVMEEWE